MYQNRGRRSADRRAGFTLIEIIIVMSIIAVLAALIAGTASKMVMAGEENTTRNTVTSLQKRLDTQWAAVTDRARNEPMPDGFISALTTVPQSAGSFINLIGTDSSATQRARLIWIKYRQMQAFPQSFAEIFNPDPLGTILGIPITPWVNYQAQLATLKITKVVNNPVQIQEELESSACLLMAFEHGPNHGPAMGADYGAAVTSYTYGAKTEVRAFKDSFGNQIVFCRWPDNSSRLNPGGPQPGKGNDKTDPTGLLIDATWQSNGLGKTFFVHMFHQVGANIAPPVKGAPTAPYSYVLFPVVVSRGADGNLGIDMLRRTNARDKLFFSTTVPGDEQDNIYGRLLP